MDNIFFYFIFSKLPQKRCQGGRRLHCQLPQSVFEEDEAEETAEKKLEIFKKSKKSKNIKKKIGQVFFYLIFRNCPQKGAQGDAVYILSAIKVFLKRMKQKKLLKVHPPNVRRGTLILFNLIDCGRLSF